MRKKLSNQEKFDARDREKGTEKYLKTVIQSRLAGSSLEFRQMGNSYASDEESLIKYESDKNYSYISQ